MSSLQQIGPYHIIKKLAEGGSSEVFLVQKQGQRFALKLCKHSVSKEKSDQRFQILAKEFLSLKQHPHPLIVQVHEFGIAEDTQKPYLVMDWIEGISLNQAFSIANLEEKTSYILQCLRALHHLKLYGLSHNDIKPENVLVTNHQITFIDFGFTTLSSNQLGGTPPYMAPEVLKSNAYSQKSDIYSFGIMLYECIYGSSPFETTNLVDLIRQKNQPLQPPKSSELSTVFEKFITSLTQPNAELRPTALQAFSMVLGTVKKQQQSSELNHFKQDTFMYLKNPKSQTDRELLDNTWLGSSKLSLIEITGSDFCGKHFLLTELKNKFTTENFAIESSLIDPWKIQFYEKNLALFIPKSASQKEALVDWLNAFYLIKPLFRNQTALFFVTDATTSHKEIKDIALALEHSYKKITLPHWNLTNIERFLDNLVSFKPDQALLQDLEQKSQNLAGHLVHGLKRIFDLNWHSLFDVEAFKSTLKLTPSKRFIPNRTSDLKPISIALKEAENFLKKDQALQALHLLPQDTSFLAKLSLRSRQRFCWAKAEALLKIGKNKQAMIWLQKWPDYKNNFSVLQRLGLNAMRCSDYAKASSYLDKALTLTESTGQKILIENSLAQILWKQNKLEQAKSIFQKNWHLFTKKLSRQEKQHITNFNLTTIYLATNDYQKCIEQADEEISEYSIFKKSEATARVLYDKGEAFYQLKNYKEALNQWLKALKVANSLIHHELLLRLHNALGNTHYQNKDWAKALDHYEQSLFYAYTQNDPTSLCKILINTALIKKRLNRFDESDYFFNAAQDSLNQIPSKTIQKALKNKLDELNQKKSINIPHVTKIPGDTMKTKDAQIIAQAYRSLLQVSQLISSEKDLSHLFSLVLKYAIQLTSAERAAILLYENHEISVAATFNAKEETLLKEISLQSAKEVIKSGKPLLSYEAQSDTRFLKNESILINDLQTILCFPIMYLGKTLGVIYLDHRSFIETFDEFSEELLKHYCQQVGLAIENAKSFQEHITNENELKKRLEESEKERQQALQELRVEKQSWIKKYRYKNFLTQSPKILSMMQSLDPVIKTNLNVLIQGESGSGKEVLAKFIHFNSARRDGPFIATNCGAILDSLIETELFGHKAGAFTGATHDKKGLFEAAHGGTLFLDEVAELSPSAQVKLLRVLQEHEVTRVGENTARKIDVRILCATHRNIQKRISENLFREDLYYRICEFAVEIPPLRDRKEDVPLLAEAFIREYQEEHATTKTIQLNSRILKSFFEYDWPGNIRELRNTIRVGCALQKGGKITPSIFPSHYTFSQQEKLVPTDSKEENTEKSTTEINQNIYQEGWTLQNHENYIYAQAYQHHNYHAKKTYTALGVSNVTLFKKIKKLNLKDKNNDYYSFKTSLYYPKKTLKEHLNIILDNAYKHHSQKPYQVIESLSISPGYFYQWKNLKNNQDSS